MVFKLIIHGDVDGAILKKDWRLHLMNNKSNIDSATLRMTTKSYNFIILLTKDLKVSLRMTMQSNCLIKKNYHSYMNFYIIPLKRSFRIWRNHTYGQSWSAFQATYFCFTSEHFLWHHESAATSVTPWSPLEIVMIRTLHPWQYLRNMKNKELK